MPDREKVAKAIEYLNWYFTQDGGTADKNAVDAWEELTREQEPVKPIRQERLSSVKCGKCNSTIPLYCIYCPFCGKKVKW